jgi:hypothetical protein
MNSLLGIAMKKNITFRIGIAPEATVNAGRTIGPTNSSPISSAMH